MLPCLTACTIVQGINTETIEDLGDGALSDGTVSHTSPFEPPRTASEQPSTFYRAYIDGIDIDREVGGSSGGALRDGRKQDKTQTPFQSCKLLLIFIDN
jgi:hypothetical protein